MTCTWELIPDETLPPIIVDGERWVYVRERGEHGNVSWTTVLTMPRSAYEVGPVPDDLLCAVAAIPLDATPSGETERR